MVLRELPGSKVLDPKSCHSVSATSGFHAEPQGAILGAQEVSKVRGVRQGQVPVAQLYIAVNTLALTQELLGEGCREPGSPQNWYESPISGRKANGNTLRLDFTLSGERVCARRWGPTHVGENAELLKDGEERGGRGYLCGLECLIPLYCRSEMPRTWPGSHSPEPQHCLPRPGFRVALPEKDRTRVKERTHSSRASSREPFLRGLRKQPLTPGPSAGQPS